jgi:hypothetical protein
MIVLPSTRSSTGHIHTHKHTHTHTPPPHTHSSSSHLARRSCAQRSRRIFCPAPRSAAACSRRGRRAPPAQPATGAACLRSCRRCHSRLLLGCWLLLLLLLAGVWWCPGPAGGGAWCSTADATRVALRSAAVRGWHARSSRLPLLLCVEARHTLPRCPRAHALVVPLCVCRAPPRHTPHPGTRRATHLAAPLCAACSCGAGKGAAAGGGDALDPHVRRKQRCGGHEQRCGAVQLGTQRVTEYHLERAVASKRA